jgi:hypothetical protein
LDIQVSKKHVIAKTAIYNLSEYKMMGKLDWSHKGMELGEKPCGQKRKNFATKIKRPDLLQDRRAQEQPSPRTAPWRRG